MKCKGHRHSFNLAKKRPFLSVVSLPFSLFLQDLELISLRPLVTEQEGQRASASERLPLHTSGSPVQTKQAEAAALNA